MQVCEHNMPVVRFVRILKLPAWFESSNDGTVKQIPPCSGIAGANLLMYYLSWLDMDRFLHIQVMFTVFELCFCQYRLVNNNTSD